MKVFPPTGIYFYDYLNGYKDSMDFKGLMDYALRINGVSFLGSYSENPPVVRKDFINRVKDLGIKRLVIAGVDPGMVKPFFAGVFMEAGLDPADVHTCSLREYLISDGSGNDHLKAALYCSLLGIPVGSVINSSEKASETATLVIGGGIAGIQASLEIANSNHKVFLLERSGTIGGHMAMFDKTFPTLDCAACILTPKMVEVGQHPNIDLITYSELIDVKGSPGNFKATILRKARRVDLAACIGCGICAEKCPGKAVSEFDAGTAMRKAIYIPFPQAVPNKYLIDAESCTYVQNGKCGVCAKVCPAQCIDLDEKDQTIEINVGNIILATGFKTFDAARAENFGYGKFPNVLTSLEFERLVNAAGPTGGNITLSTTDKKGNRIFTEEGEKPHSIAIIHCVGSRDVNHNRYCSKVCCMYSLKLAHLVTEKIPGAEVYEYFIDMRAFGKGYEEFYERIKKEGVHIIRGRTATIKEKKGKLHLRSEDILSDRLIEQEVDMVVLSVGLEPRDESRSIAQLLGIEQSEDGWFAEASHDTDPVGTLNRGIFIAGVCQGPKDIPDTVAQASAAAAGVLKNILTRKIGKSLKDMDLAEIEEKAKQLSTLTEA